MNVEITTNKDEELILDDVLIKVTKLVNDEIIRRGTHTNTMLSLSKAGYYHDEELDDIDRAMIHQENSKDYRND